MLILLEESKNWNKAHGLTGMLLYVQERFVEQMEGRFIQVLEGTEHEVKRIFEKIKNDRRHYNVTLLNESMLKNRNFKSWTMGFEQMNLETFNTMDGAFDLNRTFLEHTILSKFKLALSFLQSFYAMSLANR